MAKKNITSSVRTTKPSAASQSKGIARRRPPVGQALLAQTEGYKGNVPLKNIMLWALVVTLAAVTVGVLAARLLVSQREEQLIEDTASRVSIMAEGRVRGLEEWASNTQRLGETIATAQLVRLFVAEVQKTTPTSAGTDGGLGTALRAQTPYMQELLNEFVTRNAAAGAQILGTAGNVLLSAGKVPEQLAATPQSWQAVLQNGKTVMQPLRMQNGLLVTDVIQPIKSLSNDETKAVTIGILWFTLPVGDKLQQLVAKRESDRVGERTAILMAQPVPTGTEAWIIGPQALTKLPQQLEDVASEFAQGRALSLSVVDGVLTFATLAPVAGTPLLVLQEYQGKQALGIMSLYKPGIYLIVALLVAILSTFMLAAAVHLLAQRNKTRVRLLGQTMEALVRAVEARDANLAGHHDKVARMAVGVGNKLEMSVGERANLYYAAQLSSIGRMLVPGQVLTKKGALTDKERAEVSDHIEQATDILERIDFDLPIVPLIKQMYERMDGSGHPNHLQGSEISMMGRVLGACDAYVALTSERAHRKAFTPARALEVMSGSGQFDPVVIKALRK